MSWSAGWLNARSSIVFLLSLIFCSLLTFLLDAWQPVSPTAQASPWPAESAGIPSPLHGDLSPQEHAWAQTAWRYFVRNYQPGTGLVNSVDQYPASTMWDTGSYLMALISARRLNIVSAEDFDQRATKALASLKSLPLFDNMLPNKSYNVVSLRMVDYNNNETARGIGWSAIDLGRLFVPLNILIWHYPQHAQAAEDVMRSWKLRQALDKGQLYGGLVDKKGNTVEVQEGRLGYEQYSAKSYALMGFDVTVALNYSNYLRYADIYGIKIPTDRRRPSEYQALNYVVSEPYILDGIEYGWDATSREFSYRVYRAQEERYRRFHIPSAVSEDNLDRPPYFVYNTVYTDGKAWNTITENGGDASQFKSLSTKAVFGWQYVYGTPYTSLLMEQVAALQDPDKGWYAGQYETLGQPNRALTANTNAIVLESLCFKKFGNLLSVQ